MMETAAQNQFEWLVQATLELFKSSKRGAVSESRTAKIKILVGSSGARDRLEAGPQQPWARSAKSLDMQTLAHLVTITAHCTLHTAVSGAASRLLLGLSLEME
ncbi:predicted protein [Histoplasma capsulatum var. duboisii H88]|uniref:Predicted protein n=2 Tax=Ajellomyces capsulatus TaxID=5037 RepID=F0UCE6_AJEC8|nr:predicted protein [Histoplasma capsulatum H143]EGC43222.1 predicted protein [Histoplasma capsulatum var. duboisii H88]